jgi:hypothetical protein
VFRSVNLFIKSPTLSSENDDNTLAYLTAEEYSQVVNLAQKSNGSSKAGNAGNNDIAPPMDVETAQKRFDQLDKIQHPKAGLNLSRTS